MDREEFLRGVSEVSRSCRRGARLRTARTFVALLALVLPNATQAAPSLLVAEVVWTSSVTDRSYVDRLEVTIDAGTRPFFWTRLEGDRAALEVLREQKRLPIRHNWIHWIGGRYPDMSRELPIDEADDQKQVDVGRIELPERLAIEVDSRNYFDWRTWSRRAALAPGIWEVRVVDGRGDPLPCKSMRVCRVMITVVER